MKKRSNHPTLEQWRSWLAGDPSAGEGEDLREHLDGCAACADAVDLLRRLVDVALEDSWEPPPERVRSAAYELPRDRPVAPPSHAPMPVHWAPADVRGGEVGRLQDGQMVVGSFAAAQMSVVAVPPEGEGLWRIDGRIWLRRPDQRSVRVVLCQQDHVLAQTECRDGESFQLEELLGPGWTLEIHLPTGESYELRDPAA